LVRIQKDREEALARQVAEEEEEERFWNDPEVLAEKAKAEVAHLEARPSPPSQKLVVSASPPSVAASEVPPIKPLESGRSPSRVCISAEELALIASFRQALDNKESVNWQAYKGLKEFDRLGLEAILDLADLVKDLTLPCAVVVSASELTPIVYARLGASPIFPNILMSGKFYKRSLISHIYRKVWQPLELLGRITRTSRELLRKGGQEFSLGSS
jgi:hypothetical protein